MWIKKLLGSVLIITMLALAMIKPSTNVYAKDINELNLLDSSLEYDKKIINLKGDATYSTLSLKNESSINKYPIYTIGVSAAGLNGKIYACGGGEYKASSESILSDSLYVYDFSSNAWIQKANLPNKIAFHSLIAANNKIYTIGGICQNEVRMRNPIQYVTSFIPQSIDLVYEYDPSSNKWSSKSPLPKPLYGSAAVALGDMIYVFGGDIKELKIPSGGQVVMSLKSGTYQMQTMGLTDRIQLPSSRPEGLGTTYVYAYNTRTNTWTQKTEMKYSRCYAKAITLNGKIYVFGGGSTNVEVYDPNTNKWTQKSTITTDMDILGMTVKSGKIYIIGENDIMIYDPDSDILYLDDKLSRTLSIHCCAVLGQSFYLISNSDTLKYQIPAYDRKRTYEYQYDLNGRLISIKVDGVIWYTFIYDKNGNLKSITT